ncbi:unnamed protein product [Pleuronectes platessa]|uniref:Uncharacterized protein n=1 Tax=Pleuronectes platessa TaxID=8262 RepID=A0A9N7TIL1_PLEPL|nr:unnamed protein product [Pleuronectes platessa]
MQRSVFMLEEVPKRVAAADCRTRSPPTDTAPRPKRKKAPAPRRAPNRASGGLERRARGRQGDCSPSRGTCPAV